MAPKETYLIDSQNEQRRKIKILSDPSQFSEKDLQGQVGHLTHKICLLILF